MTQQQSSMAWMRANRKQIPISLGPGMKEAFGAAIPDGIGLGPYMVSLLEKDIEHRLSTGALSPEKKDAIIKAYEDGRRVHYDKLRKQDPNNRYLADAIAKDDPWIEKLRKEDASSPEFDTTDKMRMQEVENGIYKFADR